MSEFYDIFIAAAPKDFNKLKYLFKSIDENLTGFEDIHISVPDKEQFLYMDKDWARREGYLLLFLNHNIYLHSDKEILDIDMSKCKYRPNWIYQQYLKMFQNVTKNDLYLTIDSDVIFNRSMSMFTILNVIDDPSTVINGFGIPKSIKPERKRILWAGWQQNNRPYFEFQEKMLNLPREYNGTFISDINFMSKNIIDEMMSKNNYTIDSFIEKSFEIITGNENSSRNPLPDACYPAEPEIWGQYAIKYHGDKYAYKQAKTKAIGRVAKSLDDIVWTDADIEQKIMQMKSTDLDFYSLHSWYDMPVENK